MKPPPSVLHSVAVKYLQEFWYASAECAGMTAEAAHRLALLTMRFVLGALCSNRASHCSAVKHITQCNARNPDNAADILLGASDVPAACICICRVREALPAVLLLLFAHVSRVHSLPTKVMCYCHSKMVGQTRGSDDLAEHVTLVHFSLVMSCSSKSLCV